MRTLFIILLIVIIGFAAWFWTRGRNGTVALSTRTPTPSSTSIPRASGSPSPSSTISPTASPVPGTGGGEDINFSRAGFLVRNNDGTWSLRYDIPRASGLMVKLALAPDSVCVNQGTTNLCSQAKLTPGAWVRVQGFFDNNAVEVTRLEVVAASPTPSPSPVPILTVTPTPSPTNTVSPSPKP